MTTYALCDQLPDPVHIVDQGTIRQFWPKLHLCSKRAPHGKMNIDEAQRTADPNRDQAVPLNVNRSSQNARVRMLKRRLGSQS